MNEQHHNCSVCDTKLPEWEGSTCGPCIFEQVKKQEQEALEEWINNERRRLAHD